MVFCPACCVPRNVHLWVVLPSCVVVWNYARSFVRPSQMYTQNIHIQNCRSNAALCRCPIPRVTVLTDDGRNVRCGTWLAGSGYAAQPLRVNIFTHTVTRMVIQCHGVVSR